ncbi:glutamyl-tRNA(Gln) amidotransferase subunit A, mitochondrial [Cimex lectularius]|uniref:Glutamyl-tRNA(Gln) amidotransferase subunit A, mitochondrial n=1 Tax=Cimex lectularius TaxID=79782 RepID=A0A8I6RAP5_CIMLE|nr:glutamyl-tRNA(Gln) amidotransferase subunit A, mitochondrial [Cimex lectularius]
MLSKSISEIRQCLKSGSTTKSELMKLCHDRAKHVKVLNAIVYTIENPHIGDEQGSDVDGIPIVVKDNFCTKGIKTTCASMMLNDFVPPYNATVVDRLIKAGAVVLGKSNLDEFAMGSGTVDSIHGPTKNVWGSDLNYRIGGKPRKGRRVWKIAGGSSGGSAVAVATGSCFAALGSDTGGSTRNPAAFCGIVGFKPTYSSVSRHGLIPLVNSMDVPGILTRTVEDAALVYNVVSGYDPLDSTTVPVEKINLDKVNVKNLKIGIPKEYHCKGISKCMLDTWKFVSDLLEKIGFTVKQVSLPHTAYSIACYSVLNQCEVASNMARYDGLRYGFRADNDFSTNQLYAETRSIGLNQAVRGRILSGNYFLLQNNYEKYFEKALKVRRLICEDFTKAWNEVDILLTPTTLTEAPDFQDFLSLDNREQCTIHDYCTQPANMSGCPAISIPIRLSKNEMPLSLQLMAPNYQEENLLSLARFLEHVMSFPNLEIVENS